MWIKFENNPCGKRVGDCVVRAISKALDTTWEDAYMLLCVQGFMLGDLPSANKVLSALLKSKGFKRHTIEDCPDCYTIYDFCQDHPKGIYVLGTGSHAVTVENGRYYDAWDSGNECPIYYFEKEN